jgi:hypothetical protein
MSEQVEKVPKSNNMSRTNITKEVDKEGNESISYRKSWEKNGISHSKEVRKVEGGYIISESKYGRPKDGGEDAEYIDERKEYVSTTNPFEKKEESSDDNLFGFIDNPTF